MKLIAMVAMTPERVIGNKNDLPWHLPEDLKLFKKTTSGHPIVMGRKTWESIGKALPNRQNIVLTRNKNWSAPGAEVIHSPEDLQQLKLQDEEVYIIGGAQVYALFLPYLDQLLVSHVYKNYEGDTYFPNFEHFCNSYELIQCYDDFELRNYPCARTFNESHKLQ